MRRHLMTCLADNDLNILDTTNSIMCTSTQTRGPLQYTLVSTCSLNDTVNKPLNANKCGIRGNVQMYLLRSITVELWTLRLLDSSKCLVGEITSRRSVPQVKCPVFCTIIMCYFVSFLGHRDLRGLLPFFHVM